MRRGCERYIIDKRIKDNQKKRNTVDENEKNQMAQIDWYDFVIVEAITLQKMNLQIPSLSNPMITMLMLISIPLKEISIVY
jgi:hypothetical protein